LSSLDVGCGGGRFRLRGQRLVSRLRLFRINRLGVYWLVWYIGGFWGIFDGGRFWGGFLCWLFGIRGLGFVYRYSRCISGISSSIRWALL
jgi:hypothetical protein